MKLLGLLALGLVGLTLLLFAFKPARVKNYLLSTSIKPGTWITIEYNNPKCEPLKEGRLRRDIPIPESGYLCTSSLIITDWAFYRYYLVDRDGRRSRLTTQKDIWLERTIDPNPINPDCKVHEVESFWYGPNDQVSNDENAAILKAHPECRKGLTISP